jgi:hypothetical protein
MKTTKTHEEALALARRWMVDNEDEPRNLVEQGAREHWYMTFGFLTDFLNELYFPKPKPADAPAQLAEAAPPDAQDPGKKASDEGYKFVDWFLALLAETEAPKIEVTEATRNRWADCYDKMIRWPRRQRTPPSPLGARRQDQTFTANPPIGAKHGTLSSPMQHVLQLGQNSLPPSATPS